MTNINVSFGPWADFVQGGFSAPKDATVAQSRVKSNLDFWKWNYAAIALVIVLLTSYFYPALFVVLLLSSAVAAGLLFVSDDSLPKIGGVQVTTTHKFIVIGLVALVGLFFSETTEPLLWSLGLAAVVVLGHAIAKSETGLKKKIASAGADVVKDLKEETKKLS